jgi:hypothetical protein
MTPAKELEWHLTRLLFAGMLLAHIHVSRPNLSALVVPVNRLSRVRPAA